MATDATGTPTSLGIPKINTSVDAPSGLGTNAAMDTINALLAARVIKPGSPVTSDTLVYDGADWLSQKLLGRSVNFNHGASPPGSPLDGDLWLLPADATNGVNWLFRYEAESASGNKWEALGSPPPLYASVATSETTASTTFAALATAGPSVVLPRAGDYMVTQTVNTSNAAISATRMSYDIGGTGAVDADSVIFTNGVAVASGSSLFRCQRKQGLTAVTLTSKYRVTAGTGTFENRTIQVTPIRVA